MRIHLEVIGLAAALAAGSARAQQQPSPQQAYPPQQQAYPPQQQASPPQQQAYPPQQQVTPPAPPVQAAPAPTAAPSSSSSATSGGTPAGSQQVVVNPPGGVAAPPQQGSTTTVVNPPTVVSTAPAETYVERERPRNPVATVALDAAYGGIAGALIGTGVSLVNDWSHWQRDLSVGAGIGLIAGAAVGVGHAAIEAGEGRRYAVQDGLGSPARDPVIRRPPVLAWSGRF